MNLFKARHGAVTIFLVIILVPSLIVTSLFVDVSRMYMGNSVAESAADLALNSQLTNYDKDLNDIYGLFAHAKSEDDVINNLNNYFVSCMQSAGIEKDDATKNIDRLNNYVTSNKESNDQISDLLGIKVDGEPSITAVENANLSNPAELERQIVEFMKYRGPIDIAKNIISRFKKIASKTKNVSKESDITEKMNDYLEEEQNILELLQEAYNDGMKPYMEGYKTNKDKISNTKSIINNLKKDYEGYYNTLFKNLENTKETGKFSFKNVETIEHLKTKIDRYEDEINKDNAEENYEKNIDKAEDAIDDFREYLDHIIECDKVFKNNNYVKYQNYSYVQMSGLYNVQIYKNMYDQITSKSQFGDSFFEEFSKKANNCIDYYALIYVAHKVTKKHDKEFKDLTKKYTEVSCKKGSNEYDNADEFLKSTYVTSNNRQIYYEYLYFTPMKNYVKNLVGENGNKDNAWDKINQKAREDLDNKIKDKYEEIQSCYDYFSNAKDKIEAAYKKVKKARKKYDSSINGKFEKWGNALEKITDKDSDVKNKSESAYKAEKASGGFQDVVSKEKLQALEDRLSNIMDLFDAIMNYIEDVTFNKKSILKIENLEDFDKAAKIDEDKIVVNESKLNSNASATFSDKVEIPKVTFEINDMNHPDLSKKSNDKTVENARKLYEYCKKKFEDDVIVPTDNTKKAKDAYGDMKKDNEDGTDANSDKDEKNYTSDTLSKREINQAFTKENEKSDGKTNGNKSDDKAKSSDVGSKIGGIINGILNIIEDPSKARDELYVLDYIMEMFSYHTYNREGVYNLAEAKKDKSLSNPVHVSGLLETYKTQWENDENTFTDNKTLTNHMINLKNNYSFGNEIEYILYGGSNDSNKSKVLTKLFLIRYACNLAPEFSENWKGNSTVSLIAKAISAAYPVIPAFLVKTVLILALTALETAVDVNYLKLGMKVPIIKTKDELVININLDGSTKKSSKSNTVSGIQYSDYLCLFLFSDLINSNTHNDILKRTSSVIGKNIAVAKDLDADFDMSKAATYYELKAKVKVDPLLLKLPLMSDDMNKADSINWFSWDFNLIRGYN